MDTKTINYIVSQIIANDTLKKKAIMSFNMDFPLAAPNRQEKLRIQNFIDETPEVFKGIMNINTRNKIARLVFSELRCKMYI